MLRNFLRMAIESVVSMLDRSVLSDVLLSGPTNLVLRKSTFRKAELLSAIKQIRLTDKQFLLL